MTITEMKMLGTWGDTSGASVKEQPPWSERVEVALCWELDTALTAKDASHYYAGLEFWRELHGLERTNLDI